MSTSCAVRLGQLGLNAAGVSREMTSKTSQIEEHNQIDADYLPVDVVRVDADEIVQESEFGFLMRARGDYPTDRAVSDFFTTTNDFVEGQKGSG